MSILGSRSVLGKVLGKARAVMDDVATDELQRRGQRHLVAEPVGQDEAFLRGIGDDVKETMKERAWSVNLDKIEAPEDVLDTLRGAADVGTDPSKVIPWEQTKVEADTIALEVGLNPKRFAETARKQGWQTANLQAARQVMVESATQVRDTVQMLQVKRTSGTITDSDILGFRQMLAKHVAMQQTVSGMASEAGRQLNILKSTVSANGLLYKGQTADALSAMGGREFSLDILDTLSDMDNLAALNKTSMSITQPGAKDMVHEVWINGLLSGVRTQGVNFVGNALARGFETFEQVLAGGIGDSVNLVRRLAGKDITPHASLADVGPMLYGELKGFLDGMKIMSKTFTAGESSFDKLTKFEADGLPRNRAVTTTSNIAALAGKSAPEGTFGKALDLFFDYSPIGGRLPTRLMTSVDDFWKSMGFRTQVEMGAKRMAREEAINLGKQGDAAWVGARSQEIIKEMPDELFQASMDEARRSTFTAPLKGESAWAKLGGVGSSIRKFSIGKYIIPFVRTPINLAKWGLQRTPLGLADSEVISALRAGGVKADEAIARVALGSSAMAVGALLYDTGLVSGPGPGKDGREISRTLRRLEYTPRSIIFPGEMFADGKRRMLDVSRADPVGMILTAAADVKDVMFWADDEQADEIAVEVGVVMARALKDKTFMSGFADFITALEDPDRKLGVWIDRLAGSFVPTLLADINHDLVDETKREINGILDSWCSRMPGCSDELPPKRTLWGDKMTYEDFNMFSPLQVATETKRDTDPIDFELVGNRIQIQDLPRTWKGVDLRDVRLEDESGEQRSAYERWQELAGRGIKSPVTDLNLVESLNALLKDPLYQEGTDGPDGTKALDIKQQFAHYRSMALEQVILEFPELRQKFLDIRTREAQQLLVPSTADDELRLIEDLNIQKTPLF